MAEAIARRHFPKNWDIFSAGTEKHGLNPKAMKSISENSYDTSQLYSKNIEELDNTNFDIVLSVCDSARENCPVLPAKTNLHHSFPDPPRLAEKLPEKDKQQAYDEVFQMIESYVISMAAELS
jgi:arsenate reductase